MNEPLWLDRRTIQALHAELVREYGGLARVRGGGLLASVLECPKKLAADGDPSLVEMAAAYAFGIARNHPFIDGNKRVALAAADVFLQLNGHEIIAEEVAAVAIIRDLAAGEIEEKELAAWITANVEEV